MINKFLNIICPDFYLKRQFRFLKKYGFKRINDLIVKKYGWNRNCVAYKRHDNYLIICDDYRDSLITIFMVKNKGKSDIDFNSYRYFHEFFDDNPHIGFYSSLDTRLKIINKLSNELNNNFESWLKAN
jgi:hypothetical protein